MWGLSHASRETWGELMTQDKLVSKHSLGSEIQFCSLFLLNLSGLWDMFDNMTSVCEEYGNADIALLRHCKVSQNEVRTILFSQVTMNSLKSKLCLFGLKD